MNINLCFMLMSIVLLFLALIIGELVGLLMVKSDEFAMILNIQERRIRY